MADDDFSGEVDLFGDPVRLPSGRRGRPAHLWTARNSNKVKMLLALGWATPRIANALHVSVPTLRKHYLSELKVRDIMRDRLDARRFELVMLEAEKGNIGAIKELNRMIEKSDLMTMAKAYDRKDETDQDEERAERLGKKEAAQRAALTAGEDSDWGDDLLFPGQRPN